MLDIKRIRANPEEIEKGIRSKGVQADIGRILKLDEEVRKLIKERDELRAKQNRESETIPNLSGDAREKELSRLTESKNIITALENKLKELESDLEKELRLLPNPPLSEVPVGKDESDNRVILEIGEKPKFSAKGGSALGGDFSPKDYLTLAEALDIIDVERAGKVSGSRFGYLKGDAALLEFALTRLGLDILTNRATLEEIARLAKLDVPSSPFIPVIPPVMVRPEAMEGMGYTERGREEIYYIEKDNLYLIGTSEQAIGPMHMNEIFEEKDLPRRYVGFSSCFRREAGSYGKDTKGILRVHQFDKLEMFSYTRPEDSILEHKFLLACEEYLMQQLKLPYRVVQISTGDLGDPAAAKYDIEAWMPGQNEGRGEYRETHSTSNTTDFQARRLNIRYRTLKGELEFPHMLNGTAFATGRTIIAIIENYQTKEGKIRVPEVLEHLMRKSLIG